MIIILCGIPASGKTTLAKSLQGQLYSFDDLVTVNTLERHKETQKQMYKDIQTDLLNGETVIVDHLLITKDRRKELLSYVPSDCKRVCYVLNTPLKDCLERNKNRENRLPAFVITQSAEQYEPPTFDEGWDEIIYI